MESYIDCFVTPREPFDWKFPTIAPDLKTEFPLTDWLRSTRLEGPWWGKLLFVVFPLIELFFMAAGIDLICWITKKIFTVFLDSFGSWFMRGLVLFLFGFFTFWLIKSGEWVKLFDFLSGLWQ